MVDLRCEKCESLCEEVSKNNELHESFYITHEQWVVTVVKFKCLNCGHEFTEEF